MDKRSGHSFVIPSEWKVDASIQDLLPVLEDPSCMRQWWGSVFLHIDELCPGDQNGEGRAFKCHTKGFLPYSLQFTACVNVRKSNRVVFTMTGDFEGQATIHAQEQGDVTRVWVNWVFSLCHPRLKYFAPLLRPLFVWNHRWAMRQGHKGLQDMLASRRGRAARLSFRPPTFPHNISALRIPAKWRV